MNEHQLSIALIPNAICAGLKQLPALGNSWVEGTDSGFKFLQGIAAGHCQPCFAT